MTVLLTRRAALQAVIEDVNNVLQAVDDTDGVLVSSPVFSITPNVLERDFVHPDLSQLPFIIGRKLAKIEFETEFRGNGKASSGQVTDAPVLARLFQACGYSLTGHVAGSVIGPYQTNDQINPVLWSVSSEVSAHDLLTSNASAPADGDTVTVGTQIYTAKTTLTPLANEVLIGGSAANFLINLKAAVNLGSGGGTTYAGSTAKNLVAGAGTLTTTTLLFTALAGGSAGDLIAATSHAAGTNTLTWGTADFAGGADSSSATDVVAYYINVDIGGASGTAHMTITSDTLGEGSASAVVTSGTPITVGTEGLQLTPTFSGSLISGQRWVVWIMPPGVTMQPISDNFQSLSLVLNKDGLQHAMAGAFGTFEITAEAGQYAKVKWTFTGTFIEPTDQPLPFPNYESTLPHQVELARLKTDAFQAVVAKFTYNQANDIQIRPDVSSSDGYIGIRIVSRKPEGGIDPEADTVANYDFWGRLATAQRMPFQMRMGTVAGNSIWTIATNTQYSGMTYQDRNGILTYQAGMRFARQAGDDEIFFHFC